MRGWILSLNRSVLVKTILATGPSSISCITYPVTIEFRPTSDSSLIASPWPHSLGTFCTFHLCLWQLRPAAHPFSLVLAVHPSGRTLPLLSLQMRQVAPHCPSPVPHQQFKWQQVPAEQVTPGSDIKGVRGALAERGRAPARRGAHPRHGLSAVLAHQPLP